ncbi:MAG: AbiJ-NTD4 domain-containing protein, partial [Candidatus Entotheonellia bacterium]
MRFSQRYRFKPIKRVVQTDSIDDELRNALWSALKLHYWDSIEPSRGMYRGYYLSEYGNKHLEALCRHLWLDFFKKALDTLPDDWEKVYEILRDCFFECVWYEVYDLIEFVAQNHPQESRNEQFMQDCNTFLEREVSAYRFVNARIVRIVSEEEITAVEEALRVRVPPVREHLDRALQMLSDRHHPDYRNSIKESVSAVEALVKTVTKSDKRTLGSLLRDLERQGKLHP